MLLFRWKSSIPTTKNQTPFNSLSNHWLKVRMQPITWGPLPSNLLLLQLQLMPQPLVYQPAKVNISSPTEQQLRQRLPLAPVLLTVWCSLFWDPADLIHPRLYLLPISSFHVVRPGMLFQARKSPLRYSKMAVQPTSLSSLAGRNICFLMLKNGGRVPPFSFVLFQSLR